MKLSVIVPVYNMAGEEKLHHCLDSLVAQKLPAGTFEILAVDDCSTDESPEILQDYARRFPALVKVFRCDRNRHQGGAKNLGLSKAQGEWIGFIDADDWVTDTFYAKLLAAADRSGADLVGCDYCMTDHYGFDVGKVVHNNRPEQTGVLDDAKHRSLILDSGSLVVKIYRREIIFGTDIRFPEDIFYEDNALAAVWMARAGNFAYLPYEGAAGSVPGEGDAPLYYYYQHGGSTVHTITKKRLEDRCTAGRAMLAAMKKEGFYERYLPEIEGSFTILFYVNTMLSAMQAMKERGRYAFVTAIAREMKETFPDFQENPNYRERVNEENRKFIALQMKSPRLFYVYYLAKAAYRRLRK